MFFTLASSHRKGSESDREDWGPENRCLVPLSGSLLTSSNKLQVHPWIKLLLCPVLGPTSQTTQFPEKHALKLLYLLFSPSDILFHSPVLLLHTVLCPCNWEGNTGQYSDINSNGLQYHSRGRGMAQARDTHFWLRCFMKQESLS